MAYIRKYTIKANRIEKNTTFGFARMEQGLAQTTPEEAVHEMYLKPLDSAAASTKWGRIHIELTLEKDMLLYVYAYASNERETPLPEAVDEVTKEPYWKCFPGKTDILLYDLEGQFLWLAIKIVGKGSGKINSLFVILPGDNFMNTFPDVYREWNGFFHRYISVFSSIYNDFQGKIENVSPLFDIDRTPAELLPVFAGWLGLDLSGNILEEEITRQLVKEAFYLNQMKGTKAAVERITEIILGEKVVVVEKNLLSHNKSGKEENLENQIYGKSVYDVSVIIKGQVEEKQKVQLAFLLKQFIPIRCSLKILHLKNKNEMDASCYLDVNANLYDSKGARLNQGMSLDSYTTMQE